MYATIAGPTTAHTNFLVARPNLPIKYDLIYSNPLNAVLNPMVETLDASGYALFGLGDITPLADDSASLGGTTLSWNSLFVGAGGPTSGLWIGDNQIASNGALNVSGDWLPITDITYDLGTTTQRWGDTQVGGLGVSAPDNSVAFTLSVTGTDPSTYDILATVVPGGSVYSLIQNPGPQGAAGNPPIYRVYAGEGLTGGGATSVGGLRSLTLSEDTTGTIGSITNISYPVQITTDKFGRIASATGGATFQINTPAAGGLTGGSVAALGGSGITVSLPPVGTAGSTGPLSSITLDPYGCVTAFSDGATFRVNAGAGLTDGGIGLISSGGGVTVSLPPIGTAGTTGPISSITVDPYGRVSAITDGATYRINTTGGITGGGVFLISTQGTTVDIATISTITAGTTGPIASVTVNPFGQVVALTDGATFKVNAGTGLVDGGIGLVSNGGSVTVSMPNVGTAGTYSDPTPITTDAQGRVQTIATGATIVRSIVAGSSIAVTGSGTSTVTIAGTTWPFPYPIGGQYYENITLLSFTAGSSSVNATNIIPGAVLQVAFPGRVFATATINFGASPNSAQPTFFIKIGNINSREFKIIIPNNTNSSTIGCFSSTFSSIAPGNYSIQLLCYDPTSSAITIDYSLLSVEYHLP